MRYFLLLATLVVCPAVQAQTSTTPATTEKKAEQSTPAAANTLDPKLHADVVKLVELSGARQRLEKGFASMTEDGKKEMMKQCPQCTPEFGEEWAKRMAARVKAEDFLDVFVQAYEKHFTDDEILELTSLLMKKDDSTPATASPHLKEKMNEVMPTLMSEIMGGCTQVGAKLGAEIGQEIEKEHPEYIKAKQEKQ